MIIGPDSASGRPPASNGATAGSQPPASSAAAAQVKEGSLSPSEAAANTLHALSRSSGPSTPSHLQAASPPNAVAGVATRPSSASLYASPQARTQQQPSPFNVRSNASLLSQSLYSNVGPSGNSSSTSPSASASGSSKVQRPDSGSPAGSGSPLKREMEALGAKGGSSSSAAGSAASTPTASKSGGRDGSASKRKKANRACFHCQKAHLTCDDSRPCLRCVKKGLADTCTDGFRKKAKYLLDDEELEELKRQKAVKAAERKKAKLQQQQQQQQQQPQQPQQLQAPAAPSAAQIPAPPSGPPLDKPYVGTGPVEAQQPPVSGNADASPANDVLSSHFDSGQSAASHQSEPAFELAFDPTHNFGSEATSLEYSILSSMLNGTDLALLGSGTDSPDFQTSPAMGILDNIGEYGSITGVNGWNKPAISSATSFDAILGSSAGALDTLSAYNDPTGLSATSPDFASGVGAGGGGAILSELPTTDAGFTALEVPSPAASRPAPFDGGTAASTTAMATTGLGGYEADQSSLPAPASVEQAAAIGGDTAFDSGALPPAGGSSVTGAASDTYSANRSLSNEPLPDINKAIASRRNQRLQQDSLWKARVAKVYRDSTKPFPYPEGYHFLIKYATEKFGKQDVLRVVRALAIFRPSLIALQMPLTEEDEIFVERSFQRTILEFEKLISFSGTPTVVWRRTCEICVVGAEFCMLTQWSREELLGRYIYEFMDKSSMLDYWEKFALHAFENTTQSVMTTCTLMTPQGKPVPCAWSFTIKRDIFDLPSLVVGNFLPVLS
ncbi:uncharacterized protein PFL1_03021 [Pseudozyma flocculosa PF-1]|uniref:Transcription activator of gluconeogenesis ERT1 n=2 Tax=Pseudozyma flocculosa TaxID=84751 RepID=A0A5C3F126_9BASI|nr:uncharacterized protein PFL1_03021 [Pseudozyma flocculosa PF-1]EPQ29266.1 hypothetical protein PFL1_03021 [Pseudozyma flocculosa PF-1]SPO37770.1 related to transcriptional regulator rds2 [Pseudozyma flocculosa]